MATLKNASKPATFTYRGMKYEFNELGGNYTLSDALGYFVAYVESIDQAREIIDTLSDSEARAFGRA